MTASVGLFQTVDVGRRYAADADMPPLKEAGLLSIPFTVK